MNNQPESKPPRRLWRSVGTVFAGMLVIIIASLGTVVALHATGVFPPWFHPMSDELWWLALAYRVVYSVAGGYLPNGFPSRSSSLPFRVHGWVANSINELTDNEGAQSWLRKSM